MPTLAACLRRLPMCFVEYGVQRGTVLVNVEAGIGEFFLLLPNEHGLTEVASRSIVVVWRMVLIDF